MSALEKVLEFYHDYVNNCLMFDDPVEEILGFDEYAELHHGIDKEKAQFFFYNKATADEFFDAAAEA